MKPRLLSLRLVWVVSFALCSVLPSICTAQTVLLDDFNRTNSTTIGNGWNETETVAGTGVQIVSNQLVCASSTAGKDFCWRDVSAQYNTVYSTNNGPLTWMFNMRQSRTNPSGFDPNYYGVAFVLGSTTGNFVSGSNGYAVVLGNSGTGDNLRLVRFANGLSANANLISVISPIDSFNVQYLTVKVTYNPVGNLWSLFVDSNTTSFSNPSTATYRQIGNTVSDNVYTSNDLMFLGCFWNHSTGSSDNAYFDNVFIPSACIPAAEPTIQASGLTTTVLGASSIQLSWTRGNGTECIIVAHQNGAVVTNPVDGAAYIANTNYASGSLLAPNEYVVYSGSGTTATINVLNPSTSYTFKIFEYNGSGCATNYLITSSPSASATTQACVLANEPAIGPSGLAIVGSQPNSVSLTWTRGNGAYCLVLCKANNVVTAPPSDGATYIANASYGLGSATVTGEYVVYIGTGNTLTVTGLLPATQYFFSVFEMNGTGCNSNFLIPSPFPSVLATTQQQVSYSPYFGNLHSHSDYSDGDIDNLCGTLGTSATCAWDIANTALQFDFMGIADHNHNEGPVMTRAKFASGVSEANAYNSSHTDFVALYGMEWGTISTGGHATVYGINQLLGWNAGNYDVFVNKGDYNTLFSLVAQTPGAFSTLCHPGNTDYNNLAGAVYNSVFDNAIVGTAVRNGDAFDSTYSYAVPPTAAAYVTYYRTLLAKGYHLGPTADMDNHYSKSMGKANQGRTVVLATSRTKAAIMDAMSNMRFYATEDYNLTVNFSINNTFPMGSIVAQNVSPTINVSATDGDGETVSTIKLFFGVPGSGTLPIVLTTVNSSALTFTHNFSAGTYYYYAEITEADGNTAWTSPIWYTKMSAPLPVELLTFTGKSLPEGNLLEWQTASETDNDYFTLERSRDGLFFETLHLTDGAGSSTSMHRYAFLDELPYAGTNYYRLKQTDFDGKVNFSSPIVLNFSEHTIPVRVFPNPSTGQFTVWVGENDFVEYQLAVNNALGQCVLKSYESGNFARLVDLTGMPDGIYTLEIRLRYDVKVFKLILRSGQF